MVANERGLTGNSYKLQGSDRGCALRPSVSLYSNNKLFSTLAGNGTIIRALAGYQGSHHAVFFSLCCLVTAESLFCLFQKKKKKKGRKEGWTGVGVGEWVGVVEDGRGWGRGVGACSVGSSM